MSESSHLQYMIDGENVAGRDRAYELEGEVVRLQTQLNRYRHALRMIAGLTADDLSEGRTPAEIAVNVLSTYGNNEPTPTS